MSGKSYNEKGASGKCLSDDQLYRYVEKLLSKAENRAVQEHLDSCSTCFDDVVALARSAHTPASEAEKLEITSLRKLTPQQQVAKILNYVEAECPPAQKREMSVLVVLHHIWQKAKALVSSVSPRMMTIPWPEKPAWQFGYAMVALFVIAGGAFWGVRFYTTTYRIIQAERLMQENYQVYIADTPRLSGGYDPTLSGAPLMDPEAPSESNRPYLKQAYTLAEEAIANGSHSEKAKQLLAQVCIIQRRYSEADSILKQIEQKHTNSAAILNDLGVLSFRRRDAKTAAYYFEAAIAADAQFKEAWYNLALTKKALGAADEVAAIVDKYIALETVDGWKDAALRLKRDLQLDDQK